MKWLVALCSMLALGAGIIIEGRAEGLRYAPSSAQDFVARWSFQRICSFTFDPRTRAFPTKNGETTFAPESVKTADIIFVRDIERFFREMHPRITVPYIILTHGERLEAVKEQHLSYLQDDLIIAWFAIHPCKKTHPKLFPIPLGILQKPWIYKKGAQLNAMFLKLRETPKDYLLYLNFADSKKPERQRLKVRFQDEKFCKNGERKPFKSYLQEMARCKFVLSPAGLAPDCYRNWEALLVGSIPVVKRSQLDPLFEGLPVLIVDTWEAITQEFLNEQYKKITSRVYDSAPLYMEYWIAKIVQVRDRYIANNLGAKRK